MKLLIADDNKQMATVLAEYAKKENYIPIIAQDGEEALELFYDEEPNVILLDVMMPKMSGFEVCKEIRKNSNVPILMVTARTEEFDKIMGLEIGADDYISKPFSPKEVMARVKAIMRRVNSGDSVGQILVLDNLKISLDEYRVYINDELLSLTKKEIEILWTLAKNNERTFSRETLLRIVWGYDYFGDIRTVDSHMKRLRAKLNEYEHNNWEILTIRGVGYKFEVKNHV